MVLAVTDGPVFRNKPTTAVSVKLLKHLYLNGKHKTGEQEY
jgi:hypothetical protein